MEQGFDGEEPMDDPEAEERYRQELLKEARAYAPNHVEPDENAEANEALLAAAEEFDQHAGSHEHEHPVEGYEIPAPPEPIKAITAFLVVCMPDGTKPAFNDVNIPLELQREATLNDMYEGAAQVQRDVTIMMTTSQVVNNTVNGLMMAMQQQMQAMENQKLASQILTPNRQQRRH